MLKEKSKIIICSTYHSCINALKEYIPATHTVNNKTIVFSEDNLTLTAERAVVAKAGGSFDTEITTFKRYLIANKKADNLLSKSGAAIVIKCILAQNMESFKSICKRNFKTLPLAIYELISQLKAANVTYADILGCVEKTDGLLKEKLSDIATAFQLYEQEIDGKYKDGGSYLNELPDIIYNDQSLAEKEVFLIGYSSWTAQGRDIVTALAKSAKSLTVITVGGENKGIYLNEAVKSFTDICKENNIECDTIYYQDELSVDALYLKDYLYNPTIFTKSKSAVDIKGFVDSNLSLYVAKNIYDECEYVARTIKKKIIEEGVRYRECAVAVGDFKTYLAPLKSVFQDYNIPVFANEKYKLSESALYVFTCGFLSVIGGGFDKDDVYQFINNIFFNVEDNLKDKYTVYARKNNLNHNRFIKPCTDNELQTVADYLSKCKELGVKKGTAKEFAGSIEGLFQYFNVKNTLQEISQKLGEANELYQPAFLNQSYDKILQVIGEISILSGDIKIDLQEYVALFVAGCSGMEISLIPQSGDSVYLTDFKELRLRRVKELFAIGLNSGVPNNKSDTGILSDLDLTTLNNLDDDLKLLIEPKIALVNNRGRETLCLALLSFKDSLHLSYSLTGAMGEMLARSELIEYLSAIFRMVDENGKEINEKKDKYGCISKRKIIVLNKKTLKGTRTIDYANDYLAYRPALINFSSACSNYIDGISTDIIVPISVKRVFEENPSILQERTLVDDISTSENRKKIESLNRSVVGKEISASRLENYFGCPYKHYASNVLKLKETVDGEVQSNELGNMLHDTLAEYIPQMDKVVDQDSSDKLVDSLIDNLFNKEDYLRFKENEKTNYQLEVLRKEAKKECFELYNQFKNSDFVPLGCEVPFGKDTEFGEIKIKGKKATVGLRGRIDRIDVKDDYIRVVDYKSGSVDDSYVKLYTGNKLQLYLYLSALKSKKKTPVGAYYQPLSNDYVNANAKRTALVGQTLNDIEVIKSADKTFMQKGERSELLGISLTQKGEFYKNKDLVDKGQMDALIDYAVKVSEGGVSEMQEGFIAPTPYGNAYQNSCDICKFSSMCGFDKCSGDLFREVKSVNIDLITQAVENDNNQIKENSVQGGDNNE